MIAELLARLSALNIRLGEREGRLHVDAPKGTLTPELRDELAAHRDALLAHVRMSASIPVQPRTGAGLPVSHAQARLWLLDRLERGSPRYNLVAATRITGAIDIDAARRALAAVVARHEVLRTRFAMVDGEIRQFAVADAVVPLVVEECPAGGTADEDAIVAAAFREEGDVVFDLASAPLMRARLLRFAADRHVLVLNLHHIVADARSLDTLARDFEAAYAGSALAPLRVQYGDFSAWQQAALPATADAGLDFWRRELEGLPALLPLPTDFPRPATQSYRGGSVPVHVPAPVVAALHQLARETGSSLFMVTCAAVALVLSEQSGSDDIPIGVPVTSRPHPDLEPLIGLFANTVVLRCRVAGGATTRQLLADTARIVLAAFAHQDTPFEKLVEALHVRRDLSYSPIFQVMLSFLNREGEERPNGVAGERMALPQRHALFELDWQLRESSEGLTGFLMYAADLFAPTSVERLAGRFVHVLQAMAAEPDRPVADLDLLPPAERQLLVHTWNRTTADVPKRPVHSLVEEQARRTPDAVAVRCSGESWSYRELDERANAVAAALQARGIGKGALVGISAERSLPLMAALLGILKAGAAYVPLDPAFPAERLAFMAEDAGLAFTVTNEFLAGLGRARSGPAVAVGPEDPMYVIYTSGSTGRPKGVVLPHRAIANFLASMAREPGFTANDTLLAVTTLSFDIAVLELLLPLVTGGTVVLARRDEATDPQRLMRLLQDEPVTVMQATPATWRLLIAAGWQGNARLKVLCGGEALPRDLSAQLLTRSGELWNMYGPTETAVWSAVHRVIAPAGGLEGVEPIGRPIANTQIYLLDERGALVPTGAVGELCIAGAGVAHGYWNQPALTAERFVADPFGTAGSRMYRTGDRARYQPDGTLEFLGRGDAQIKLRGFRIEPGEIESVLGRHPLVAHCAVVVRGTADDQRLVTFYVASDREAAAEGAVLREHLRSSLPEYMLPAAFVRLDEMPLTPNGKIDRQRLPDGEATVPGATERPGDLSPLELTVRRLWGEVLRVDVPPVDANFFDLGGHSLLVVRLHQRLVEECGASFEMLDLFRHPTVRSQAALLAGSQPSPQAQPVAAVRPSPDEPIAIVGMACRFPGAADVDTFWRNLRDGVESIRSFPTDAGSGMVGAHGQVANVEAFDAEFFGISPREAEMLDPQHRVFLECAWEAVEHAGYAPDEIGARCAVVASAGLNSYLLNNILSRPDVATPENTYSLFIANDKDFLPTRVSYKLNLRGPSLNVNTACSSSLVAVHMACDLLRSAQCDVALAGGVSLQVPQDAGYLYQRGGILSADGHCRAFDAEAEGTVPGSGAGIVVLKRLRDALAAGDTVHAVIRGSAINNDGALKAGYTAPAVDGQAAAIGAALAAARVPADSIGYVEAHGTATALGDPIEVTALAQAFATRRRQYCWLGAVKTNIGHLDTAAGVAGLIKATLALSNEAIPPTLHYRSPNPRIDFASTPFRVCAMSTVWPRTNEPRRAGVSSFGIGGTNAHVVLEEAPRPGPAHDRGDAPRLFVVSARTRPALDRSLTRLAAFARETHHTAADIAWTLAMGRKAFRQVAFVVASSPGELADAIAAGRVTFAERPDGVQGNPLRIDGPVDGKALERLGGRWAAGAAIDWRPLFAGAQPRRVPLPTYPFERTRHWIEPGPARREGSTLAPAVKQQARRDLADWFYVPTWTRSRPLLGAQPGSLSGRWLALARPDDLDRAVISGLATAGADVTVVESVNDFDTLIGGLAAAGNLPSRVLHTWTIGAGDDAVQALGFNALLQLVRACASRGHRIDEIVVMTSGLADVVGTERLRPRTAVLMAPVAVIPEEYPGTSCRCIDVGDGEPSLAEDLLREIARPSDARVTAWRGGSRWLPRFELLQLPPVEDRLEPFRERGTYLITGGVGGLGLLLAEFLAEEAQANLVLTGRRAVPPPEEWDQAGGGSRSTVGVPLARLATEIASLESRIDAELAIARLEDRPGLLEAANALAAAYALDYFEGARALGQAGQERPLDQVYSACRVIPKFRRLVDHLLVILEEQGWVRVDDGVVTTLRPLTGRAPAAALLADASRRYPGLAPEFELLDTCAAGYPAALSGEIPAISVLFPDGGRGLMVEAAEKTEEYSNSRVYRTLLAEFLARLARQAEGRPFRILEVGGGNAIMTGLIAERLAASGADVEYVFTDIGRTFVTTAEARARERGYRFMSFRTFDISRDPAEQGLEPGSFDAVIGLDVVHATPSIRDTVGHLTALLAEGGLMCLVESSRTYRWNDMVWGLAEGWWMFTDGELRNHNSPLLSTAGWEMALANSGFSAVTAFPQSAAARARTLCSLIVAQRGQPAPAASGQHRDRHALASLARIRRRAGGLMVRQVDVADEAAMESLVCDAEAQFGPIHGVIHAAAVEHKSLIASRTEPVETMEFRPKVDGTLVLDRLFANRPLDFMALYSSITGVIGGGGQVGYCGANAFLDAFASERARRRREPTVSINWGRWQSAGLARDFESWHEARTGEVLQGGMTAAEGIDALRRAIAHRIGPRVAVMTHEWRPDAVTATAVTPVAQPALAPTASGSDDIEDRLAAIWRQLLGAAPFDRHTPFQDVGGDSLVGIQLVARIREQFGVQLPIQAVFDAPTIAELSARIVAAGAEEIEEGAL